MLTAPLRASLTTILFLAAILLGSLLGSFAPNTAEQVAGLTDLLILLLVGALFFTLRLDGLPALRRAPRTVLLAIGMNFLAIIQTSSIEPRPVRRPAYPAGAACRRAPALRSSM